MDLGGFGKYNYTLNATFCIGFNGIKITKDMLSESKNPYEKEFLDWQKDNKNIDNDIVILKKQIDRKKTLLRINPFNRKAEQEEIANMMEQLSVLEEKRDDGAKKKNQMETFDSLTTEQKKEIAKYLDSVDECQKIGDNIIKKVDKAILIGKPEFEEQREKWARAFENMMTSGQISQEEIEKVKEIFFKEIKEKKEIYTDGMMNSEMSIFNISHAIQWFVEHVSKEMQLESISEDKKITMSGVVKAALQETTTAKVNEATNIEISLEHTNEGETKDEK